MLKNLDPLLSPELLYVMSAMGHGDELVIVDCNFPITSVAQSTVYGKPIRFDGVDIPPLARAVLSVFPLDSFVEIPCYYMQQVGKPEAVLEVHHAFKKVMEECAGPQWMLGSIERHAFYERAKRSYAVVGTTERRPYGCFILTKGVIAANGTVG